MTKECEVMEAAHVTKWGKLSDRECQILDNVSHPAHYTGGGIEAKDALKAAMGGSRLSPMASYWWGCAFKYLWRWSRKNGVEDLLKCRRCIDFLIDEVEGR